MPGTAAKAPVSFVLEALSLQEAHLLHLALTDALPLPTSPLPYAVSSKAEVLFNDQFDDTLRVDLHTTITSQSKSKAGPKPRVKVQVAVLFQYRGLGELRRAGTLPLPLAYTAVSLAYSTVRGMLQVQLAGTSLSHVLLPIVGPQQLWEPSASQQPGPDSL